MVSKTGTKRVRAKKTLSFYKASELNYKGMTKPEIKMTIAYKKLLGRGKSSWNLEKLVKTLCDPLEMAKHASKRGIRDTIEYANLPRSEKSGLNAEDEKVREEFCIKMLSRKLKPTTKARNEWTRSPAKASKRALVKHRGVTKKKVVRKAKKTPA